MNNMLSLMRDPFFNRHEYYNQSKIPEEGLRVTKGRWVEDEYEVVYVRDEEGDVTEWKYVKVKPEKQISFGGTTD